MQARSSSRETPPTFIRAALAGLQGLIGGSESGVRHSIPRVQVQPMPSGQSPGRNEDGAPSIEQAAIDSLIAAVIVKAAPLVGAPSCAVFAEAGDLPQKAPTRIRNQGEQMSAAAMNDRAVSESRSGRSRHRASA
jgi:Flp pilus assembly pilin Flp